jgi:hypothetical protein
MTRVEKGDRKDHTMNVAEAARIAGRVGAIRLEKTVAYCAQDIIGLSYAELISDDWIVVNTTHYCEDGFAHPVKFEKEEPK